MRSAGVSSEPNIMVAVGLHAERVRLAHDLEPGCRGDLVRADLGAHAIDQHLGAAAGQRVEAGRLQAAQRLGDRQTALRGDVGHLGRRQRVHVDAGSAP